MTEPTPLRGRGFFLTRPEGPDSSTVAPSRVAGVDIARAVAVSGVVINHGVDGIVSANLLPASSPLVQINAFLYTFRMPALAFLIGLFIPGGVRRVGARAYAYKRIATVLYLYVLWFYLQGVVEVAASGVKNHPRSLWAFLQPWAPFGQLWFLPYLAVATGVIVLCGPWLSHIRAILTSVGSLVVGLAVWGWNPDLIGLHGLSLIPFSVVGSVIGLPIIGRMMAMPPTRTAILLAASGSVAWASFGLGAVPPTQGKVHAELVSSVLGIAAAVSGTLMLLLGASLIACFGGRLAQFLGRMGRHTLAIYLAHVAIVGASRLFLVEIGVTNAVVILAVAVPTGIAIPLYLGVVAQRTTLLSWLFEPPRVLLGPVSQLRR